MFQRKLNLLFYLKYLVELLFILLVFLPNLKCLSDAFEACLFRANLARKQQSQLSFAEAVLQKERIWPRARKGNPFPFPPSSVSAENTATAKENSHGPCRHSTISD